MSESDDERTRRSNAAGGGDDAFWEAMFQPVPVGTQRGPNGLDARDGGDEDDDDDDPDYRDEPNEDEEDDEDDEDDSFLGPFPDLSYQVATMQSLTSKLLRRTWYRV